MIKKLENKIKELVPDIITEFEENEEITEVFSGGCISQIVRPTGRINIYEKSIGIREVLLALNQELYPDYCIMPTGVIFKIIDIQEHYTKTESTGIFWNLSKDDLTKQKPEVIELLSEILC